MGLSAVCDCGISLSFSLTFLNYAQQTLFLDSFVALIVHVAHFGIFYLL